MEQHKIIFDTLDWESLLPGVRYKRYNSDNKQIRLVEYDKSSIKRLPIRTALFIFINYFAITCMYITL